MTEETIIKRQIKQALGMVPDCFVYYNLQGLGAYKGVPDMTIIKGGIYYALEVKTPRGRMSEHQERFKEEVELAGGKYFVVTSPEEVLDIFNIKYS